MSEHALKEAFRQLALDLDAVSDDDPDLRSFELDRDDHHVELELHAYKSRLDINVRGSDTDEKRPQLTVARAGALESLGQSMGIDEKSAIDDPSFQKRFDLQTEAPAGAVAALFESRAARDAVRRLDELGVLPVWIADYSVGVQRGVDPADLEVDRVRAIIDALVALETTLGTWDTRRVRTPLSDAAGRRLIQKTPKPSRIGPLLDMSPLAAFGGSVFMVFAWMSLPGFGMVRAMYAFVALAVAVGAIAFFVSLRVLRGEKNALSRTLARTFGVGILGGHLLFFALHAINRTDPGKLEKVHVVSVVKPAGKGSGVTEFTRRGSSRVYRIGTGWRSEVGTPFPLVIHEGRLGWPWAEYAN